MMPQRLRGFLDLHPQAVLVEIVEALGSTPREEGAWMVVSPDAMIGTIGGGQLEFLAIDHGRKMLVEGGAQGALDIPLGPEISQCCGGRVKLAFRALDSAVADALVARVEAGYAARPHVYVFGAGHVGNALGQALALLPFRTLVVDTRTEEIAAVPEGVEKALMAVPEAVVRDAPKGSAFVVLTHEHSLDFLIVHEALMRGDAAYVGMIGSKTKKGTFRSWLKAQGADMGLFDALVCPIGGAEVDDKRPQVIAALTAAEIVRALAGNAGDGVR